MENNAAVLDFFLGTTTAAGFYGCFSHLQTQEGLHLYLLKGAPGCGKSTLMRKLCARAGQPVQCIHCCSDPASLDGVIFPAMQAAVLDATPPHSLEPATPGAGETVVSLYDALREDALRPRQLELASWADRGKALRRQAARYVGSAAGLVLDNRRTAAGCADFPRLRRYIHGLAGRLFPRENAHGTEQTRFVTGITPDGMIFYKDTLSAMATTMYVFHDSYGAVSRLAMELLRQEALDRGHRILTCRCALCPESKIDHLILPDLGLAFLTSNPWHPCHFPGQKNIYCARFLDLGHLRKARARLRFHQKTADGLLANAIEAMAQARVSHHALEALYAPAVDFSVINAQTEACAARLGLSPTAQT